MRALLTSKWTKVAVFLLCLVPFGALIWRALHNGLGANPVEFIQLTTGRWTLRFLIITVGFLGFLLLAPLAMTSTAGWIRRLGGKRWQMLHRAIYFAAVAGVIHYYWKVKSDVRMPLFYGALVAILLLWRVGAWLTRRRSLMAAKLSSEARADAV